MKHSYNQGRGHSHRRQDKHHALKTSLQAFGLLICLRLLLPYMFPREREDSDHEHHRDHSDQPPRYHDAYNENYIPAQSRLPEMNERRRITNGGSEWGGTTVYDGSDVDISDTERLRRRERRERRRRRRMDS